MVRSGTSAAYFSNPPATRRRTASGRLGDSLDEMARGAHVAPMTTARAILASALALAFAGCREAEPEQAWIVVDLVRPDGQPAQVAFNNPDAPDMTLAECKSTLQEALPTLLNGLESKSETRGGRMRKVSCVMSVEDPSKLKD